MLFRKLSFEDKVLFDEYARGKGLGWEYNFSTICSWLPFDDLYICEGDEYLLIAMRFSSKLNIMPPFAKSLNAFSVAVENLKTFALSDTSLEIVVRGLDKSQAEVFRSFGFEISTSRDDYDYIYSADELKELKGKRFHSKRNFVNRFFATYDYVFRDYVDSDYDKVVGLYDKWEDSEGVSGMRERFAIIRALTTIKELGASIGVLYVGDNLVGFAISYVDGTVVHSCYEKADRDYVGAYQALNMLMARRYFPNGSLVNRQEDLGDEGLRKAKLSYNPKIILEKFSAKLI